MVHLAVTPVRPVLAVAAVAGGSLLSLLALAAGSIPAPDEPAMVVVAPAAAMALSPVPDPPVEAEQPQSASEVQPPSEAHPRQLMFVFRAGGATYMRLADVGGADEDSAAIAMPRHGKLRMSRDKEEVTASVAPVADRDVPAELLRWQARQVEVDEVCRAKVTGFAVVARLVGDADYAGVDRWTASTVMKRGHVVLAARLDNCVGGFARDAASPAFAIPTQRHDATLEAAARAALLSSSAANETQVAWDEARGRSESVKAHWYDEATFTSEVLDHPRTGAIFVSVHGHVDHGCGDPEANVWGLFRVQPDGTLVAVQLRQLGDVEQIDALLDVDGTGELVVLGRPWLGLDRTLTRADGELIDQLVLPLFGCPC